MMWISKKKQAAREQAAYEAGIAKGWEFSQLQQRQTEHKGFILSGVLKEVDVILRSKGGGR